MWITCRFLFEPFPKANCRTHAIIESSSRKKIQLQCLFTQQIDMDSWFQGNATCRPREQCNCIFMTTVSTTTSSHELPAKELAACLLKKVFYLLQVYQKIRPATRAYFQLLRRALAFGQGLVFDHIMLFWPILAMFGLQQ